MQKQQGMTLIGMLMTLAVVVILGVLIIRVVPVYIQYYTVTKSINGLKQIPTSDFGISTEENIRIIKASLLKRLDINEVDDLVRDGIVIKPKGQFDYMVTVKYRVIKPLVYNISLMFDFETSQEVNVGKN